MKLPIKKKYFDLIKSGKKKVEFRDAHITFVCEETGEVLRRDVKKVHLLKGKKVDILKLKHPNLFDDDTIMSFELEEVLK